MRPDVTERTSIRKISVSRRFTIAIAVLAFFSLAVVGLGMAASADTVGDNPILTTENVTDEATVEGTVTDANTNESIANVTVELQDGDENLTDTETDANGTYELTVDTNGTYELEFRHDGYETTTETVEVTQGENKTVNVSLTPAVEEGTITGTVTDEADEPLEGILVSTDTDANATTDINGSYELTVAVDDTYTVDATDPDGEYETATESGIEIDSNETTVEVNFTLSESDDIETGTLEGTVEDADTNESIANATVELQDEENVTDTETDANGTYGLEAVAGNYTLVVAADSYETEQRAVELLENETTVENVALTPEEEDEDAPRGPAGAPSDDIAPFVDTTTPGEVSPNNLQGTIRAESDVATDISVELHRDTSTEYSLNITAPDGTENVTFFLQSQAIESSQDIDNVTMYIDEEAEQFYFDEEAGPGNSPWIAFEVAEFSTRTVTFSSETDEPLGEYIGDDGTADVTAVLDAIDDWRVGELDPDQVLDVIDAWRSS